MVKGEVESSKVNGKGLSKELEGLDFELVKYDRGNKLLAVVARLCLPLGRCFRGFSTLGICEWFRLLNISRVGVNV